MQNDRPHETEATDASCVPATSYEPPAILWREKFPVRSVIGMSDNPAELQCGGSSGGYEGN
jgi:hypothetical protein